MQTDSLTAKWGYLLSELRSAAQTTSGCCVFSRSTELVRAIVCEIEAFEEPTRQRQIDAAGHALADAKSRFRTIADGDWFAVLFPPLERKIFRQLEAYLDRPIARTRFAEIEHTGRSAAFVSWMHACVDRHKQGESL